MYFIAYREHDEKLHAGSTTVRILVPHPAITGKSVYYSININSYEIAI